MESASFSFENHLNNLNGVYKPCEYEIPTLSEGAQQLNDCLKQNGAVAKGFHPAVFGDKYKYTGMVAIESVGPHEVFYEIPAKLIMTTKKAFYSEINSVFRENPDVFGSSNPLLKEKQSFISVEDSILITFILYERHKGKSSFWYNYILTAYPMDICGYEWTEAEFQELQSTELRQKILKAIAEVEAQSRQIHKVISAYPQYFGDSNSHTVSDIMNLIMVFYSRAFGYSGIWDCNGGCVPGADMVNHENVDTVNDIIVNGNQSKRSQIADMPIIGDDYSATYCNTNSEKEDQYILNQGKVEEIKEENTQVDPELTPIDPSSPFKSLEEGFSKCEDDFTMVLKTGSKGFEKGSQLYLSYQNYPNGMMILNYRFCNFNNIYNYLPINIPLTEDEHSNWVKFKQDYAYYIEHVFGNKAFNMKRFRIYMDRINIKLLKFIKICTLYGGDYSLKTLLKPEVLEVEHMTVEKAIHYLQEALQKYPTTWEQDMQELATETRGYKYHMALVYRSENKKLLINQIKCLKILTCILKRLSEHMNLQSATERVNDLETEEGVKMNRKVLEQYLHQLKQYHK